MMREDEGLYLVRKVICVESGLLCLKIYILSFFAIKFSIMKSFFNLEQMMSESSMLTNDRRRETYWFLWVILILCLQFLPVLISAYELQMATELFLYVVGVWTIALGSFWSFLRVYRLKGQRPWCFLMMLIIFGASALSYLAVFLLALNWPHVMVDQYEIASGLSIVFMLLVSWQACCSLIYHLVAPARKSLQRLGISIYKPLHLVLIGLSCFAFYLGDRVLAFAIIGIAFYLGTRYGYNRWIFMRSCRYPFEQRAARQFIRRASQVN